MPPADAHDFVVDYRHDGRRFAVRYPAGADVPAYRRRRGLFPEFDSLAYLRTVIALRGIDTVLDVGALTGAHALYFDRVCGVRTHCFEASPRMAALARDNLARNGAAATLHAAAVSDRTGVVRFSLSHVVGQHRVDPAAPDAIETPSMRLDDLLDALEGTKGLLIKIDVEGHELQALAGAAAIIDRFAPEIFIEIGRENRVAYVDWFRRAGYRRIANIGKNQHFSRDAGGRWRLRPWALLCAARRDVLKHL